jgi:tetratricopeptide (TPR) repeat protein
MNWETWGAPIAVLSAGIVAGLVLVIRSKGMTRRNPMAEAWAQKDSLVDQLRALRADRNKLSDQAYLHRWDTLLTAAAEALRSAEQMDAPSPETEIEKPPPAANRTGRRIVWAVMILAFFIGLGAVLQTATSDRTQGGIMTGGSQVSGTTIAVELAALEATAKAEPTNIDPINRLAHLAIQQGDLGKAMTWMDAARALKPDHPEVRTHLAILQASVGMPDRAKQEIEAALSFDPAFSEALLWKGLIALQAGEREAAVEALESALENAQDRESRLMATQALAKARRPPATVVLRGQLSLAPEASVPQASVLFVMVRAAAEAQGPPVAAVRLDPRGIPGNFVVTDRDIMMGGPWPDQVWVEARIDADGNPSTKSPADLTSERLGPFGPGSEDIALVLKGGAPPPATAQAQISGTLSSAAGTSIPAEGAIFVIVRRTPTPKGPPVAAVKLTVDAHRFSVGKADIMMGGPWPEQVWIQARADGDGNAMTKSADDLESPVLGPFGPGAGPVDLLLSDGTSP